MKFEEAKQLAINGEKISLDGDSSGRYWTISIDNSGKIHYTASIINSKNVRESFEFNSDKLFDKKYNWIKYEAVRS